MERAPFATVVIGPTVLLREGVARILSPSIFRIIASASSAEADADVFCSLQETPPELLIIEAGSGTFDPTIRQIKSFKARYPAGQVAVLAHDYQLPEILSAFRAGANAYFDCATTCDVFTKSLELVMLGETLLPPTILTLLGKKENGADDGSSQPDDDDDGGHAQEQHAEERGPADDTHESEEISDGLGAVVAAFPDIENGREPHLSARQKLILRCLIEGDSNKTIARKIHITEATVKVHVKAILRKVRVHNRTQAAVWAMSNGSFISAEEICSSEALSSAMRLSPGGTVESILPPPRNSTMGPRFGGDGSAALSGNHRLVKHGVVYKSN